ncbi:MULTISPECIES: hypothetical protein [unclassified Streptomyces]|uniref:hypothetical protein n=1 Tax=unclassified Streptomyces TaxID=2593676 RepID=UPI0036E01992
MRRTARALSVAVLAGLALGVAVPVAFADPAAEVSPGSARPGGSVTVSVFCDPDGSAAPPSIEATSQAFDEVAVPLQLVPGNEDDVAGPAYRGTARIASAEDLEAGPEGVGPDSAWTVDGTCPGAAGGEGKQWSATFTVTHGGAVPSCAEPRPEDCSGAGHTCTEPGTEHCPGSDAGHTCTDPATQHCSAAPVQRGVRAGAGGAFTDSVPALVTGGLLIAGALGAAAYRVHRRGPRAES